MGISLNQLQKAISKMRKYVDSKDPDVGADFLTQKGYGNLRFYQGKFQYYETSTSTWVDAKITDDNIYIMNISPQTMKSFELKFDPEKMWYKFKFEEPDDTVIDGQIFCFLEGIKVVRKLGSSPKNENDGTTVLNLKRKNFGKYKSEYYIDTDNKANIGETWYYKAFPYSTVGVYCYSDVNEKYATCKDYFLYGFKINQAESDPANMITYIEDNEFFTPVSSNLSTHEFNYGDWKNAFFMPKPCMLKFDGTVDYYLDPDDYTKKADGGASDFANSAYEGNAMIEWGQNGHKIWTKYEPSEDGNSINVYISNKQVDNSFHAYSFINSKGDLVDHFYTPITIGTLVDGKLRSIGGDLSPSANLTRAQEIEYAKANNLTDDVIWFTEVYSDRLLIDTLLLLMCKTTNTRGVYGNGNYATSGPTGTGHPNYNKTGMFFASNSATEAMKVFGMMDYWGNMYRAIAGYILDNGKLKVKLTYGTQDGSTTEGYNTTCEGYNQLGDYTDKKATGYISKMKFNELVGWAPVELSGSATTYFCDYHAGTNDMVSYALFGVSCKMSAGYGGVFQHALANSADEAAWYIGAALSCKPLKK